MRMIYCSGFALRFLIMYRLYGFAIRIRQLPHHKLSDFSDSFFVFVRVASWCYDVALLLPIRNDDNYPRVLKVISVLKVPSVSRVSNVEHITTLLPLNNPFMPFVPFCWCANRGVA